MSRKLVRRLDKNFYLRPTTTVAKDLLGKVLVRTFVDPSGKKIRLSGRITETEAYLGVKDRACHTFGNRKTARTQTMYLEGGHSYVYLIYGLHHCFNVTTRKKEIPEAVLIRAVEPLDGIEILIQNRKFKKTNIKELCDGPGKLCQAFGITRKHDRLSLLESELFIEEHILEQSFGKKLPRPKIKKTPRIGVEYAKEAALWPLRFLLIKSETR